MPLQGYRRGPWYRGGVSRSYIPPTIFASVGCAICLIGFSVVMIIGGGAMLGFSRLGKQMDNDPAFDSEFFRKHRQKNNIPDVVGTIGGVILGIGCTMFAIGIVMCIVAGCLAKKQENKRHAEQQSPLSTASVQPPPPSAYPHQPSSQNVYPAAGSYPAQPFGSTVPMGGQYPYPAQYPAPTGYYPPPSSTAPPGNQYPPPTYTQSAAPNVPPQDVGGMEKQPL